MLNSLKDKLQFFKSNKSFIAARRISDNYILKKTQSDFGFDMDDTDNMLTQCKDE